jgi:hypothetical protein
MKLGTNGGAVTGSLQPLTRQRAGVPTKKNGDRKYQEEAPDGTKPRLFPK